MVGTGLSTPPHCVVLVVRICQAAVGPDYHQQFWASPPYADSLSVADLCVVVVWKIYDRRNIDRRPLPGRSPIYIH